MQIGSSATLMTNDENRSFHLCFSNLSAKPKSFPPNNRCVKQNRKRKHKNPWPKPPIDVSSITPKKLEPRTKVCPNDGWSGEIEVAFWTDNLTQNGCYCACFLTCGKYAELTSNHYTIMVSRLDNWAKN